MTNSMHSTEDLAADQAAANAALAGLTLTTVERQLVDRRRRGQVDHADFLHQAATLATTRPSHR